MSQPAYMLIFIYFVLWQLNVCDDVFSSLLFFLCFIFFWGFGYEFFCVVCCVSLFYVCAFSCQGETSFLFVCVLLDSNIFILIICINLFFKLPSINYYKQFRTLARIKESHCIQRWLKLSSQQLKKLWSVM